MTMLPWLAAAALGFAPAAPAYAEEAPARVDADEQLQELLEKFNVAYAAFRESYSAAETDEERMRIYQEDNPSAAFAPRFVALAKLHPKTDTAWQALTWAVSRGDSATQAASLGVMVADFKDDERLGETCMRLTRAPASEELGNALREVIALSPHHDVQGKATFALALQTKAQADELEGEANAQALAEFRALIKKVQTDFGEVDYFGRGTLGAKAEATVFELDRLQIGMVAPDIDGEDLDGVNFKLSDYRGKVVVIDFWGDW